MQRLIWLATGFMAGAALSLLLGLLTLWVTGKEISPRKQEEMPFSVA